MKSISFTVPLLVLTALMGWLMSTAAFSDEPKSSQNLSPEKAQKLIHERKDVVILDVRTPKEFHEGHLRNAKNIDARSGDFAKQLEKLDKSKTYLVHCAHGHERTAKALDLLKTQGFKNIFALEGGIKAWESDGRPVEQ